MKRKSNSKENGGTNWPVILLILCIAVSVPVVGVFTWRASEVMSDNDVRVLTGVMIAALLFVVDTAVLGLFLVAYSRLRISEEIEESRHEEALTARIPRQETRYNYNIRPGQPIPQVPVGMTYQIPPGYGFPQQTHVEAPPKVEYVENGDVTLGG